MHGVIRYAASVGKQVPDRYFVLGPFEPEGCSRVRQYYFGVLKLGQYSFNLVIETYHFLLDALQYGDGCDQLCARKSAKSIIKSDLLLGFRFLVSTTSVVENLCIVY